MYEALEYIHGTMETIFVDVVINENFKYIIKTTFACYQTCYKNLTEVTIHGSRASSLLHYSW